MIASFSPIRITSLGVNSGRWCTVLLRDFEETVSNTPACVVLSRFTTTVASP